MKTSVKILCGIAASTALAVSASAANITVLGEAGPLGQTIATIDSNAPGVLQGANFVSGLAQGESLLGIDYRPLTGQLYGLGSQGAIYVIDSSTGTASRVGTGFDTPLNGESFGFDFNPVIDKIRIVSDANQNIVANPDTGAANIATTTPVAFASGDINEGADPNVVQHAYSGNVANSSGTQLYAIDTNLDALVTQANNAGTLATVGALGFDAESFGGFDISDTGEAFAIMGPLVPDVSTLFAINLLTGEAIDLGSIGMTITGMSVMPSVPVPAALWLFGSAVSVLGWRRRKITS